MNQAADTTASRLFAAIIEFWSLVLRQESWALVSKPDLQSSVGDVDYGDGSGQQDFEMDSGFQNSNTPDEELRTWNLERFLLAEECDRLCLWKFSFTDEDLDRLTSNQSSLFGGAVIQSLVNIGQALIKEADTQSFGVCVNELKRVRQELESLILRAKGLVHSVYYDGEAETHASTYESIMTDLPTSEETPPSLHQVLKTDIGKLQRLSFSISQTLADMRN